MPRLDALDVLLLHLLPAAASRAAAELGVLESRLSHLDRRQVGELGQGRNKSIALRVHVEACSDPEAQQPSTPPLRARATAKPWLPDLMQCLKPSMQSSMLWGVPWPKNAHLLH